MSLEQKKKEAEQAILKILMDLEKMSSEESLFVSDVDICHYDDEGKESIGTVNIKLELWT